MKNLPIGIQTFSDIINEDYLYIDKTKDIYKLFEHGGKYYFLSRPRRFGKSLLVSILKEIFSGNKKLFRNLWIYDKIDWKTYPVIHIDFTEVAYETVDLLKQSLEETLEEIGNEYNVQLKSVNYKTRFGELIKKLAAKGRVVLLIDEYDKPIINLMDQPKTAQKNRNILKAFYETIKSSDKYLKFVFITGVSRFFKMSVFSGLNNLKDISLSDKFSTLLGYTEEELRHYFKDRISALAGTDLGPFQSVSEEEPLVSIRRWYNGYSWDGSHFVYNPHSILNFFDEKKFGNYWFSTATPSFLVKAVREKEIHIRKDEYLKVDSSVFENYDIEHMKIASLLFQTGYLTVKKRTFGPDGDRLYCLSFPNKEVSDSFSKYLLNEKNARQIKHSKKSQESEALHNPTEEEESEDVEIERDTAHENRTGEHEKNVVPVAEDFSDAREYDRTPLERDRVVEEPGDRNQDIKKAGGNLTFNDTPKERTIRQSNEPQDQMIPITKILILSANPKTTPRLRLDEEIREIKECLNRSKHRSQFRLQVEAAVRIRDIRRSLLDFRPNIVHFTGHGKKEGILVEDELGMAVHISKKALSGLFELFSDQVDCVILSDCYSESQAKAINKHINYVVGMHREIKDKAVIEFAVGFYDALGTGKSIEEAFQFGRNAILERFPDLSEHMRPVLIKKEDLEK